jgi:beta-glucosidase
MTDEKAFYLDPTQPIETRARDLLARMTLEEKSAQLGSAWVFELLSGKTFSEQKASPLLRNGIGQITRIGGASSVGPVESAELANTIQAYLLKNTRLSIPALVHEECWSGYMARNATCFPQIIGLACTWEPELAQAMAQVIRTQMRAVGAHQGLAPVLDVTRDPRWGRTEETFGEDPYLIASMGSAYVRGLQSDDLAQGVLATGKHFVGYGMSEGGMNWAPVHLPQRELLEVFVTPFEAAIKTAKLASIMNAYHELDGIPCGSRDILKDLLRDQLGFDGIVVSDYFAVNQLYEYHRIARDKIEAAHMGLEAGIDYELPSTDCYGQPLIEAVRAGKIPEALVDEVVLRGLKMKFALGLFEKPYVDSGRVLEVFDNAEQRALARQIAQKSLVLLKNEGSLLPLKKDVKSLALIGPNADSVRNLIGDYAYPAHIETLLAMSTLGNNFGLPMPENLELEANFVPIISILEGIKNKVSAATQIHYAKGCDVKDSSRDGFAEAVAAAQKSDVVILVMGDKAGLTPDCTTGESRDRAELNLPGVQDELVEAVYAVGKPVVLVLVTGRPLAITWAAEHIPAIVEAWLPSEEGANAIADVLFGDVNPGGKTTISFPRGVGQIPVYYNHKPSGGRSHWSGDYVELSTKPLFPFGYGLSYTTFGYGNLQITPEGAAAGGHVTISFDLANTGAREGDEIAQLYIRDAAASVTRPVKELKAFKRVSLKAGESKRVSFDLHVNQLGFYNPAMDFVVEPGTINVMIGASSEDIRLEGTFEITGAIADIGQSKVFFSDVSVS